MAVKKTTTEKKVTKAAKPAAKKAKAPVAPKEHVAPVAPEHKPVKAKAEGAKGRYVFATGRRKTAIANVRLFSGAGEIVINKKPLDQYFTHVIYRDIVNEPFKLTGLANDFYFTAHVSGGGIMSQAGALRHGLAHALALAKDDIRKILKKNSLLTRDDRKKERKKPGLKRARRSPQWAKR